MRFLFLLFIITGFIGMQTKADTDLKLTLETTAGNIEISLLPELAPNHVARISELAETGFYDGIIFHRVIPGFMAQTGDPDGMAWGDQDRNLKQSFPIILIGKAPWAWQELQIQIALTRNFSFAMTDVHI